MKATIKIFSISAALLAMLLADIPLLPMQLVPDAQAIFGVRRRTAFRTAVIVGGAASAEVAAANNRAAVAQQQAVTAQQQAAAAEQQAAAARQQAAAPAAAPAPAPAAAPTPPPPPAGATLPLGSVVSALPPGCAAQAINGIEYYHCGGNYYRAVFQGNSLVYVTTKP
ncbi:hypothetical protein [Desulfoferula mesophila]|uniref:Uncharacterized protein n=1 Tax=Desulfoferula mesophila TaxID=3058419 RepID=A0AAU9EJN5_9BACT|nr:hypothetical protein FAK_05300 [Desulfoferula mesophilus]